MSEDARARYDRACHLAAQIRGEWELQGSPLLTQGGATGRAVVPHPLVKMLAEAERDADRFERAFKRRHSGPAPSAVVGEDVGVSPAAKLRSVR